MRCYYVYIARCRDNKLYIGITNNVERRLYEHNFGKNKFAYTFSRRPVKLVFQQQFSDPEEAISFEKKIKKWSKLKKEALIMGDFDKIHDLADCKNVTNYKNKIDNDI